MYNTWIFTVENHIFLEVQCEDITTTLKVEESHKINIIKEKIQDKLGIPCNRQLCIFDYKVLEDDCTLHQYDVTVGSTLCVKANFSKIYAYFQSAYIRMIHIYTYLNYLKPLCS